MNFLLILSLGAFGLAMGAASVLGYTRKIEPLLWVVIAVVSTLLITTFGSAHPFWHGLLAGLLMGICNSIMQSVFFSRYIATHPEAAQFRSQIPGGLSMHVFFLFVGPLIGAAYGILLGLLSILAVKIML